jgi:hypothetical protein
VAEGATIITQKNNEEFFDRALNTPRTLLNDTLAKNPKKAKVEAVGEKKVYSDGTRTVEMYHIYPAPHSNGLMVATSRKRRSCSRATSRARAGTAGNDHVKALVPALEKLKVTDFDRYINVHTSAEKQTKAELWKAAGSNDVEAGPVDRPARRRPQGRRLFPTRQTDRSLQVPHDSTTSSPQAAFARTCSGDVAPAITEATCGHDASHENASSSSV